jgi:AmiR/NasT family two-component response regulator
VSSTRAHGGRETATVGALRRRVRELELSARVGRAVGMLMERLRLSDHSAYAVLHTISRKVGRSVEEVADQLTETGQIPVPLIPPPGDLDAPPPSP